MSNGEHEIRTPRSCAVILQWDRYEVNNKQQDKHIEAQVWGEASDKTPVYAADVIVTYQVLPEKSAWPYANVSDIKTSIAADAQAEANRKLAESLSDTLIDYQKIQKWDGKGSTYFT